LRAPKSTRLCWEPDRACWVAPQLGSTRDGRLLLLIDRGEKLSKFDWPMLSQWQMKNRGMSNQLFISKDRGHTWDGRTRPTTWAASPVTL
jgi:hypothetical protein